jgi:adenylate kinase family enzyme
MRKKRTPKKRNILIVKFPRSLKQAKTRTQASEEAEQNRMYYYYIHPRKEATFVRNVQGRTSCILLQQDITSSADERTNMFKRKEQDVTCKTPLDGRKDHDDRGCRRTPEGGRR